MEELPEQMSSEMLDQILEANIYTYRLTDGSYIVAEELDFDLEELEDSDEYQSSVIFVTIPGQIVFTDYGYQIKHWNLTSIYDLTELNVNNIVSRSEAPIHLKSHYLRFVLINKIEENLEEHLIEDLFTNDAFDKQDLNKHNRRWEWKPENN